MIYKDMPTIDQYLGVKNHKKYKIWLLIMDICRLRDSGIKYMHMKSTIEIPKQTEVMH